MRKHGKQSPAQIRARRLQTTLDPAVELRVLRRGLGRGEARLQFILVRVEDLVLVRGRLDLRFLRGWQVRLRRFRR